MKTTQKERDKLRRRTEQNIVYGIGINTRLLDRLLDDADTLAEFEQVAAEVVVRIMDTLNGDKPPLGVRKP